MTLIMANILRNQGFKVQYNNEAVLVGLSTRKVSTMEIKMALMDELEEIELSMASIENKIRIVV